jgi:hypothetical protein
MNIQLRKLTRPAAVLLTACLPFLSAGTAVAADGDSFEDALTGGKASLSFRYRYEYVDQDGISNDAKASTLRTRINYRTGDWYNFAFFVEGDNVSEIGNDQYNSTRNGKTNYPTVADPKGTDLNQLYLDYMGLDKNLFRLGKQRINLDNQRFVGGVGWRQNEQTYDAVTWGNTGLDGFAFTAGYINNVNRIFGPDGGKPNANLDTDTFVANAAYTGWEPLKIVGYAYLMDISDADALSNDTYGIRGTGTWDSGNDWSIDYTGEFAYQEDAGDNPIGYDANYYLLEGAVNFSGLKLKVGYEVLEGDNGQAGQAFRTPLATLHAFQGWADKFLTTPDGGIEDLYFSVSGSFAGFKGAAIYHNFEANSGPEDYGDELDIVITHKLGKRYSAMIKYADYDADDFATDTSKAWLMLSGTF